MKQLLRLIFLIPVALLAQTPSKPAPAKKPPVQKPGTAAVKKPGTTTTKSGTTAVKKPGTTTKPGTTVKKPSPQVVKLTEKAYLLYRESKDAECEKVIKQILALDPRNKDAFLLRANIAMFGGKYDEMWVNLDKIYKYNPGEPEIYSNFAVTHLNYAFLSDSLKRVLCRKTIKLAGNRSDGYVNLGMVAMAGGYYRDALSCFDISYRKQWKDTLNKVILNLYYARCLYGVGDTSEAISLLEKVVPRLQGSDKYTAVFLRARYKLDMGDTAGVKTDIDTLNVQAGEQPDVWVLQAKYHSMTGRKDLSCMFAGKVRQTEGGEAFDISEYCDNLTRSLDLQQYRKLTYSLGELDFVIGIQQFTYPGGIQFNWSRTGQTVEAGTVYMTGSSLDSAYHQMHAFNKDASVTLDKSACFWLSKAQFRELRETGFTRMSLDGITLYSYRKTGREQIEVFDQQNREIMVDCIVISDGVNKVCYLDDQDNPLIVKIESDNYSILLMKFE